MSDSLSSTPLPFLFSFLFSFIPPPSTVEPLASSKSNLLFNPLFFYFLIHRSGRPTHAWIQLCLPSPERGCSMYLIPT
ncbi:hypothetical protein BC827DRAFT_1249683 [Russula dissimulans]|nr:hypothetical protein BC827DRAFT_1249683 [Russula dissimulans]